MNDFFRLFLSRFSILFKVAIIGFLILLLLIPLHMVDSVLRERLDRRDDAISDITSTWGPAQTIAGPVLVIPYQYSWKEKELDPANKAIVIEVTKTSTMLTYFLPSELLISGNVEPTVRKRGIYEAILYRADLKMEGSFENVDPAQFKPGQDGKALWDQAYVALAVSDLRGVDNVLKMKWDDQELLLLPGVELPGFSSGVHARAPLAAGAKSVKFSLDFAINGSSALNFAPVGVRHQVKLASSWPNPSFGGAILPQKSQLTPEGFDSTWEVSYYGRKYPQAWSERSSGPVLNETTTAEARFGVRLLTMVDNYRSTERAIKYGILFIVLIFLVFFLFELIAKLRMHMFQYILVGAALCLFYLALLSLSEFLQFGTAYLIAAIACTLMITLYSLSILRSGVRTIIVGLGIFLTYAFLYVILQMEEYSLIAGTVGLFVALGAVMYATRHVNWYGEDDSQNPPPLQKS